MIRNFVLSLPWPGFNLCSRANIPGLWHGRQQQQQQKSIFVCVALLTFTYFYCCTTCAGVAIVCFICDLWDFLGDICFMRRKHSLDGEQKYSNVGSLAVQLVDCQYNPNSEPLCFSWGPIGLSSKLFMSCGYVNFTCVHSEFKMQGSSSLGGYSHWSSLMFNGASPTLQRYFKPPFSSCA